MFTDSQLKKLRAPLDKERVKTRKGDRGMVLSYLEGYDVIDAANDIFGFGMWDTGKLEVLDVTKEKVKRDKGERFDVHVVVQGCATVRAETGQAVHCDVGYGSGQSYEGFGPALELAYKEAATDCLKRCLRYFGNQFGNSLYGGTLGKDEPEPVTPATFEDLVVAAEEAGFDYEDVVILARSKYGAEPEALSQSQMGEFIAAMKDARKANGMRKWLDKQRQGAA